MIEAPKETDDNIRAQCVGVSNIGIEQAIKIATENQTKHVYSEQRQRRILVYKEVLTERLLGIKNASH